MSTAAQAGRIVIGIDLGTTNSLAAVRGKRGPVVLRDQDGEALIPSVVTFPPDAAPLVGRKARALRLQHPDRTIFSVKRLIGRAGAEVEAEARLLPYPVELSDRGLARIRIGERAFSPEQVSALILQQVKAQAEAALAQPVAAAVITVPAYFDDAQRQATKDAAALANLDCLRILNEPTAASLAYGIDGSKDGTVLVYDLGGGTFDVSILRIQDGTFRVLATAGNTHLGGDDFDRLLAERFLAQVGTAVPQTPYVRQAVLQAAEGLKLELSRNDEATLALDLGEHGSHRHTVTRQDFEAMIAPLLDETLACCRRAARDAKVDLQGLDHVVLVGGSTRVPLVRARLQEITGRPPRTDVDPDLAVALGAAIQADVLAGNDKSVLLLDVIPLSLGIETAGHVVHKLILRNATIPASVTEEFSTGVDHQTAVDINVYQGEREMTQDCRHLASFKLRGIPPMPAGLPRIAVTFLIDADGVLRVTAREKRTGIEQGIQVVPNFGLSRDEVRKMMQESLENAERDVAARQRVELRQKAEAMAAGTVKALALSELPPDQTFAAHKAAKRLQKLLGQDGTADADLQAAVDELSKLTAQIADDVIGSAVQKALREEQRP